jgi:pimeloyl-ACP methyl ester carboxylesterase
MDVPDIQYTRSGDVAVAYQVVGDGPVDVVWFRGMAGDLLSTWDQPLIVRHAAGLTRFSRLLMFDKRGTGLSDRVREAPTLETRMDDVRAVMDAAGSERAVLWTAHEGSRTALLFAATYPERTAGLVLLEPSVRGTGSSDYPWAPNEEEWRSRLASVREGWGQREFFAELLREWAPSLADDDDFKHWFIGHMRRSLSPGAALSFFRTMKEADVSDILSSVGVPTLILCKPAERAEADYVAERIPGSEVSELPGLLGLFTRVDDEVQEQTMRETERFLTRIGKPKDPDRVLQLCCSPTSSAPPNSRPSSGTRRGVRFSSDITLSFAVGWGSSMERKSTLPAMAFSLLSMVRGARSSVRAHWYRTCARSGSRSVPVFTPASAS